MKEMRDIVVLGTNEAGQVTQRDREEPPLYCRPYTPALAQMRSCIAVIQSRR